ncbi:hypothetical protein Droror1_Dr00026438 [Drosera rotundifolia]
MMELTSSSTSSSSSRRSSCMNLLCGTTSSPQWKKGWILRSSAEPATLCLLCGSAFENHVFCDTFHAQDSGWRNCVSCGKLLHCGCIASLHLIDILDTGGVKCTTCTTNLAHYYSSSNNKPDGCRTMGVKNAETAYLGQYKGSDELKQPSTSGNVVLNGFLRSSERGVSPGQFTIKYHGDLDKLPMRLSQSVTSPHSFAKDISELPAHPKFSFNLGVPVGKTHCFGDTVVEDREPSDPATSLQQGPPPCHIFPKIPQTACFDANLSIPPQLRFARPPAEGRGRNHLLPRYWPRITDQELQQISGDSNCTIVPLFEKVLSASDAGRIGRLVLPKACAEAYFPPISQPEGLPLRVQDVKGNHWVFQFRFWPNNNSRMYVLEGVTLCIQSMQLQAGDTVTFSRMDPEGKLLMGFRKASSSISQSIKGSSDSQLSTFLMSNESTTLQTSWGDSDKYGVKKEEDIPMPVPFPERRKARNIGSKSKRLLIDHQEVLELKLRWEEVQEMLRPPQNANPTMVVVEDYEFEEYEEPPVFGKWSVFAIRSFGVLEQWTQCDSCYRWRRIPVDVLLPAKWSCTENTWDHVRSSCSAPEELSPRELEKFVELCKDFRNGRVAMSQVVEEKESCGGLEDGPANAAIVGVKTSNPSASSVALTTKHPRHRPGCTCIVCIQPPSGKGKHSPDCICSSCQTVKRRFKTMMLRKKQRQSEQEAEMAPQRVVENDEAGRGVGNSIHSANIRHMPDSVCLLCIKEKDRNSTVIPSGKQPGLEQEAEMIHMDLQKQTHGYEAEGMVTIPRHIKPLIHETEETKTVEAICFHSKGFSFDGNGELGERSNGLDLNCQPTQEAELQMGSTHDSMSNILQPTGSLETYMKEKASASLALQQQASPGSSLLEQTNGEATEQPVGKKCVVTSAGESKTDDKDKGEYNQC